MISIDSLTPNGVGPYVGHTLGASRRPVMFDPHYATEGLRTGRGQNLNLVIGTLGAGKSVLIGQVIHSAARRGIRCVVSDPSGPLAALCRLPELEAVSQEINLLNGRRGILSPASLIPSPARADYEGEWDEARQQVEAERRDLTVDMALRCLPEDLMVHATRGVLRQAARSIERWETTTTMWDLIDQLDLLNDPHASAVSGALVDASTAPLLRLLFPVRGEVPSESVYDKVLTVITTPGIDRAADGVPRRDWNPMEIGADAVLRLVGLFTNRLIYSKSRSERCIAVFDEAESLTDFGPGRSMLSRLGRDHSKWNISVWLAVKSINDQMLSGELKNFLATVWIGRMASAEPAMSALKLIGLSDERYVPLLLALSSNQPGQFVLKDVAGEIGSLRVDVDYYPPLKAVLLTDPTPEGSNSWILEEEMH